MINTCDHPNIEWSPEGLPMGTASVVSVVVRDDCVGVIFRFQQDLCLKVRTNDPAAATHLLWMTRALLDGTRRPPFIRGTTVHVESSAPSVLELSSTYSGIAPRWLAVAGCLGWVGTTEVASILGFGPLKNDVYPIGFGRHVFQVPAPSSQEPWQWPRVECSVVTLEASPWRPCRLKPDMWDSYLWGSLTRSMRLLNTDEPYAPVDDHQPEFIRGRK